MFKFLSKIFMKTATLFILFLGYFQSFSQSSDKNDLIRTLIFENQYQSALDLINTQQKSSYDNKLNVYKGIALRGVLKYNEAIESFNTALKNDSSNMQILTELSNTYKTIGDYNKALIYLTKANNIRSSPSVLSEIASAYFTLEKYESARIIFSELLKQDSLNPFLIKNLAICYDFLEKTDSSIFYFEKALELKKHDSQSVNRLCNLYIKKKNYINGIEVSESYKLFDTTNWKINRINAYLYFLNKDYNISTTKFTQCVKNNDTTDFVYKYLGISYFKLEVYDTAQMFLEKAYFKDTADAQICYFLGMSCSASYYKELGIKYINKAITLLNPSPEYMSGVYQNLAQSYNGYYKYPEALEALLKSYELNPKDTLVLYKIGSQYDRWLNNKTMALKYYTDFVKILPVQNKYKSEENDELTVTYYDVAVKRIAALKEDIKKEKELKN